MLNIVSLKPRDMISIGRKRSQLPLSGNGLLTPES